MFNYILDAFLSILKVYFVSAHDHLLIFHLYFLLMIVGCLFDLQFVLNLLMQILECLLLLPCQVVLGIRIEYVLATVTAVS